MEKQEEIQQLETKKIPDEKGLKGGEYTNPIRGWLSIFNIWLFFPIIIIFFIAFGLSEGNRDYYFFVISGSLLLYYMTTVIKYRKNLLELGIFLYLLDWWQAIVVFVANRIVKGRLNQEKATIFVFLFSHLIIFYKGAELKFYESAQIFNSIEFFLTMLIVLVAIVKTRKKENIKENEFTPDPKRGIFREKESKFEKYIKKC